MRQIQLIYFVKLGILCNNTTNSETDTVNIFCKVRLGILCNITTNSETDIVNIFCKDTGIHCTFFYLSVSNL